MIKYKLYIVLYLDAFGIFTAIFHFCSAQIDLMQQHVKKVVEDIQVHSSHLFIYLFIIENIELLIFFGI